MGLEEIISQLIITGEKAEIKTSGIDCYLFGSILKTNKFNDIDILIIYKYQYQIKLIKSLLKNLIQEYPVHILFLTLEEELEFNFITDQGAKEIFRI